MLVFGHVGALGNNSSRPTASGAPGATATGAPTGAARAVAQQPLFATATEAPPTPALTTAPEPSDEDKAAARNHLGAAVSHASTGNVAAALDEGQQSLAIRPASLNVMSFLTNGLIARDLPVTAVDVPRNAAGVQAP